MQLFAWAAGAAYITYEYRLSNSLARVWQKFAAAEQPADSTTRVPGERLPSSRTATPPSLLLSYSLKQPASFLPTTAER